jgi:hypothetical protein
LISPKESEKNNITKIIESTKLFWTLFLYLLKFLLLEKRKPLDQLELNEPVNDLGTKRCYKSRANRQPLETFVCGCGSCQKEGTDMKNCWTKSCEAKLIQSCKYFKCYDCMNLDSKKK